MFLISEEAIKKTISTKIIEKIDSPCISSPHKAIEIITTLHTPRTIKPTVKPPTPRIKRDSLNKIKLEKYKMNLDNNDQLNTAIETLKHSNSEDKGHNIEELIKISRAALQNAAKEELIQKQHTKKENKKHEQSLAGLRRIRKIYEDPNTQIIDMLEEDQKYIINISNKWNETPESYLIHEHIKILYDKIKTDLKKEKQKKRDIHILKLGKDLIKNQKYAINTIMDRYNQFEGVSYVIKKMITT